MVIPTTNGETRQDILRAALKRFAHGGYAATSVQQIVGDAKVSKPTLYYYFSDKAELFQALVNEAHDERFRRIQVAVKRAKTVRSQLVEILVVLFDYFRENRELMRISLDSVCLTGRSAGGLQLFRPLRAEFRVGSHHRQTGAGNRGTEQKVWQ